MIFEYKGIRPVIHPTAFVHPQANVTGHVSIGANVYIGPGAVIRGDWGEIIIKDGCNVQENCVIHIFPGKAVILEENAHIGHGAVIHGAHIGKNALIGMNSVVMDEAKIGDNCIVGALSFVPSLFESPNNQLIVGNPASCKKTLPDLMIQWKREGTGLYQQLAKECHDDLKECEPLTEPRDQKTKLDLTNYLTWPSYKEKHK